MSLWPRKVRRPAEASSKTTFPHPDGDHCHKIPDWPSFILKNGRFRPLSSMRRLVRHRYAYSFFAGPAGYLYHFCGAGAPFWHTLLLSLTGGGTVRQPGRTYFSRPFRLPHHVSTDKGAHHNWKDFAEDVLRQAGLSNFPGRLCFHVGRYRHLLESSLRNQHLDRPHLYRQLLSAWESRARPFVVAGRGRAVLFDLAALSAAFLSQSSVDCGGGGGRRAAIPCLVLGTLGTCRPRASLPHLHGRVSVGCRGRNARAQAQTVSIGAGQPVVRFRSDTNLRAAAATVL